jgi:hypothetical protein
LKGKLGAQKTAGSINSGGESQEFEHKLLENFYTRKRENELVRHCVHVQYQVALCKLKAITKEENVAELMGVELIHTRINKAKPLPPL